jgi:hypothetical protein
MTPLFKKLNFKQQSSVLVVNCPPSLEADLREMSKVAIISRAIELGAKPQFVIGFFTQQKPLDLFVDAIVKQLEGDAILWLCYPKASSKNFICEFNRDTGWAQLGFHNFEPVRQVAIDLDWSALRFRKVEFIKTITRRESMALSLEAKKRTSQKAK